MKILEINTFNKVVGGVESYVASMSRALLDRGHQVVPLYLMHPEDHPGLIPTHRGHYMVDLTPHHLDQIMDQYRSFSVQEIRQRLHQIIDCEQPDLVHCNNIYSPVIVRELFPRLPVVRTVHDYRFLCPTLLKLTNRKKEICQRNMGLTCLRQQCISPFDHHGLRHLLLLRWELEVSKDFDRLITKSEHMKRQLVQGGIPAHKVDVIPLSIPLPALPDPAPQPMTGTIPRILFVGRIAPEKGLDVFIRALARISSDFTAVLAGDGPSTGDVQELLDRLGLQDSVTLAGWQGGEDLQQLYRDCDLVVVPSVWPEPFGLVGLEAMAHAKPVIGFNVGGIPEWLDHEHTGLLVEVGDEDALVKAMAKLLDNPALAAGLGNNGRREAETRFAMDVAATKLLRLFENVLRL